MHSIQAIIAIIQAFGKSLNKLKDNTSVSRKLLSSDIPKLLCCQKGALLLLSI